MLSPTVGSPEEGHFQNWLLTDSLTSVLENPRFFASLHSAILSVSLIKWLCIPGFISRANSIQSIVSCGFYLFRNEKMFLKSVLKMSTFLLRFCWLGLHLRVLFGFIALV